MAKLKPGMVKGSTLLEVIVAMVIILIVFSMAIGIYNNVLSVTFSVKRAQAKAMTENLIRQSINEQNWKDEELTQDSIGLQKTVVPYEQYSDLVLITVTAFEQEKQIGQSKRITKKTDHGH